MTGRHWSPILSGLVEPESTFLYKCTILLVKPIPMYTFTYCLQLIPENTCEHPQQFASSASNFQAACVLSRDVTVTNVALCHHSFKCTDPTTRVRGCVIMDL